MSALCSCAREFLADERGTSLSEASFSLSMLAHALRIAWRMTPSATAEAVFFSENHALEDEPRAGLSDASTLARAVLRLGRGAPRMKRFRGGWRSASVRLERASLLLREALRREREGVTANLSELWERVHEEWTALTDKGRGKKALLELAASCGLSPKQAGPAVEAVFKAIQSELLPGVHALLFHGLTQEGTKRKHFHHERWQQGMRQAPHASPVLRAAMLAPVIAQAREAAGKGALMTALEHFQTALESLPRSRERVLLGRETSRVAGELTRTKKKEEEIIILRRRLALLDTLSALAPHDFGLYRSRSAMHIHLAIALIERENSFLAAGQHLAMAYLLDPLDDTPARLLTQAQELLGEAYRSTQQARRQGHTLNSHGEFIERQGRAGWEATLSYPRTQEGQALARATHAAALGETALRLGLMPLEPASIEAVKELLQVLASEGGTRLAELHERLCARHPVLAGIPWGDIVRVLQTGAPPIAEVMAVLLNEPPLLALDMTFTSNLEAGWRRSCKQGIAADPSSPGWIMDRWVVYPWLFSSHGLLLKASAMAGLVLCLAGTGPLAHRAWQGQRRDEAFQRLTAARQAGEPAQVTRSAWEFLMSDPGSMDPRITEVARASGDALMSQMLEAIKASDSQRLQQLSSESDQLQARLEPYHASGVLNVLATGG